MLAYYVPSDPASWASLEVQAQSIDVVAAQWVTIDARGQLASRDDQTLKRFARARGLRVFPSLLTTSGWLNHRLLTDDETSARAVAQIVDYVTAEGYDGFDLDLEAVRPTTAPPTRPSSPSLAPRCASGARRWHWPSPPRPRTRRAAGLARTTTRRWVRRRT